jgi:hypothetical protein
MSCVLTVHFPFNIPSFIHDHVVRSPSDARSRFGAGERRAYALWQSAYALWMATGPSASVREYLRIHCSNERNGHNDKRSSP